MQALIFGHGYSAGALTPRLISAGWSVVGTSRGDGARIRALGAQALRWPGDETAIAAALAKSDAVLISVAPDADGDPVLSAWGDAIAAARPRWLGYLSTTGVYGDHAGGWVDEDTPPRPGSRRGTQRVAAEAAWRDLAERSGLALRIFRLAGIYGPGRGPFAKLRAGTARRIVKPGQVFSRIHVDDIGQALMASITADMADPTAGGARIYNICDDDPAPPQDVIGYAAQLLDLRPPAEESFAAIQGELSPMARSFYGESKRVRNDRAKAELGLRLRYPDYRAGLRAVLARELSSG